MVNFVLPHKQTWPPQIHHFVSSESSLKYSVSNGVRFSVITSLKFDSEILNSVALESPHKRSQPLLNQFEDSAGNRDKATVDFVLFLQNAKMFILQ